MTDGVCSATYSYLANSPLVEDIVFKQNATTRMTTTKAYDYVNRLTSIGHADGATTLASYAYGYNAANQRTNVTHADSSHWTFDYDDLGQVSSGKKRNLSDLLFPGLQYEYDYDDIGNRTATRSGGDTNGANLRTNAYTQNLLNQYSSRGVGPYVEVHGEAATNATVTVNNLTTERRGGFYRKELSTDNSAATVLQGITNVAVLKNAGTDNKDIVTIESGAQILQQNPEAFTYDADGNLTSDGLWTNTWNGENRLIQMESRSGVPDAAKKKLVFAYDHQGRRISKDSYVWNTGTSSYDLNAQRKFVYDGWNLIVELDGNTNLVHGFTWGLDLSGSEQGAGGVGGLLMVITTNAVHLVGHDGNGNVSALVSAADSTVTANYEYSPFGKLVRASGPMALLNPIRFSSKYQDDETGYNYYGHRFYNPDTGRWLNRDPLGDIVVFRKMMHAYPYRVAALVQESRSQCYVSIRNDVLNGHDFLGLTTCAGICKKAVDFYNQHKNSPQKLKEMFITINGGGAVICENGQACGCPLPAIYQYNGSGQGPEAIEYQPGECPSLDAIVADHENEHIELGHSAKCPDKCNVRQLGFSNPDPKFQTKAECDLRKQSRDKLLQLVAGGTLTNTKCRKLAVAMYDSHKKYIQNNCNNTR